MDGSGDAFNDSVFEQYVLNFELAVHEMKYHIP